MEIHTSRIIILDKDDHFQELIRPHLESISVTFERISNRDDLLNALQQDDADAVLAHHDALELDGVTALEMIKSLFPLIPVLIIFDRRMDARIIDILKRGAADYLLREHPDMAAASLQRALEERRSRLLQKLSSDMLNHQQRALGLIASGMPLSDVLDLLCFILTNYMRYISCAFHRVRNGRLTLVTDSGIPAELREILRDFKAAPDTGTIGAATLEERAIIAEDIRKGPSWKTILPEQYPAPYDAVVSLPFFSADESVNGVLTVFYAGGHGPDMRDYAIMDNIIQIAAIAVETQNREERLNEAISRAEIANREKSRFIVNISHEIRTPMNGIIGMGDLLAQSGLNPDQRELLGVIRKSGDFLLSLIDDIIDLSRIESGNIKLEEEPFYIRECLMNVINFLTPRAREKGTRIEYEFDDSMPPVIVADEIRLAQIVTNLVNNAVKFTEKGEIRIAVAARIKEDDLLEPVISVTDTGPGIPPEKLESIFQPFVQLGAARTKERGAGLGLAISSRLAGLMGGRLAAQSEPGRGSQFYFHIRARMPREGESVRVQAGSAVPAVETRISERFPLRILIAEDDEANRFVIVRLLEKIGYVPDIAVNGMEALDSVSKRQYDIILMDVEMPEMDGLETTRRITAARTTSIDQRPVIIALTANAMKEDMQKCLDAGMADYLTKPVNLERISGALMKWGGVLAKG